MEEQTLDERLKQYAKDAAEVIVLCSLPVETAQDRIMDAIKCGIAAYKCDESRKRLDEMSRRISRS